MPGVHLHLRRKGAGGPPPRGWMAVRVGGEGEEQQRFLVPVGYVNHPLFVALLRAAEEEYGFHHSGAITIPCHVEHFRHVRGIIDRDTTAGSAVVVAAASDDAAAAAAAAGHQRHHNHHHHHGHFYLCFRA